MGLDTTDCFEENLKIESVEVRGLSLNILSHKTVIVHILHLRTLEGATGGFSLFILNILAVSVKMFHILQSEVAVL